ncbi:MAG: hypothetical protein DRG59_12725 [Deltaproteobacteria bacterium]|nr:MAG: hypothetical protein DRG59_12725 [Deltaproteobacteria bacterium]
MQQVTFIIASGSYPLNKGLSVILNEIKNAKVVAVVEDKVNLIKSIADQKPDYLLITKEIYHQIDTLQLNEIYKASPKTQLIDIKGVNETSNENSFHKTFYFHSGKKETSAFFIKLVEDKKPEIESTDSELSEREITVLKNVAVGKTNKEIADDLFLSIHTVITHRKNITNKLGIKSISGLTVYAIINGFVAMEEVE